MTIWVKTKIKQPINIKSGAIDHIYGRPFEKKSLDNSLLNAYECFTTKKWSKILISFLTTPGYHKKLFLRFIFHSEENVIWHGAFKTSASIWIENKPRRKSSKFDYSSQKNVTNLPPLKS